MTLPALPPHDPHPELDVLAELARRLSDLSPAGRAAGAETIRELRPALHRTVVAPGLSGAVKTLVVQALLLLDDPRVVESHRGVGSSLLLKIRKLLQSALAAHAAHNAGMVPTPALGLAAISPFSPDALLSAESDPLLVEEFVVEAREQLAIAEAALLVLDSEPENMASVDAMFRALHTIKGTSAFLGVEHATELAHHTESLLARVRAGEIACVGDTSSLLFRAIDMLDAMLVAIERAPMGVAALLPDGFRALLEVLRDLPPSSVIASARTDTPPSGLRVSGPHARPRCGETGVRVRAADLDRLSDAVHELMLTNAMLARDAALRPGMNVELARKVSHAASVAREIEEIARDLRLVPFATAMQKATRAIRDAAMHSGKLIELVTVGDTLLIERSAAEALGDALMHMTRNAVDHGIETVSDRERAGKAPVGRVSITARHDGTGFVIEVADDGRGLDARRLTSAAIDRGLLPSGTTLDEREAFALVFRPGFSTAAAITGMSGRGVGMDVVRANIESLGGRIEIDSRAGEGTTFTIRLPERSRNVRPIDTWGESPRTIGLIA